MRRSRVYIAWFLLHFFLIVTISARDTFWLIARGLTILPSSFRGPSEKAENVASALLFQIPSAPHALRASLATYLHSAGIERGYGYFAPNIPPSYKLVFELHYPDGRVAYELPAVNSSAASLRVAGLLDQIGRTRNDALREYLIKMLARAIWREHPDAQTIRAIFGRIDMPSMSEFERGTRESYEFLYAYDFSLNPDPP